MTVETDINLRWEHGLPHHPKSMQIYSIISTMDWEYGNDYFCWTSGGDGDNGEMLMYLIDIYFEQVDAGERKPIPPIEKQILLEKDKISYQTKLSFLMGGILGMAFGFQDIIGWTSFIGVVCLIGLIVIVGLYADKDSKP